MRTDDPTSLSALFHLNSEPWLNEEAYRAAQYIQEFKIVDAPEGHVALPAAAETPLAALIRRRQSARMFGEGTLPLASLSGLLAACYGIAEVAPLEGGGSFLRRSVPSAGGLYPLEAYAIVRRVEGLRDGLYHYDVRGHALEGIRAGDLSAEMEPIFLTFPFVHRANLILCLAAMFPRIQKKYGPRGYRYTLLEAGHAAQNLCLAAAELELASLCMGGFFDSRLNGMLGLDPLDEGVVYSVAVGLPA
jgi:SagB-type dehydrogenase family enzyme